MKLNLEQVNEMIYWQERKVKINEENLHIVDIGINDNFLKSFQNKLDISKRALLRLKQYKRKLLQIELIRISNEISFYDFGR